jgi:hypothetical protein
MFTSKKQNEANANNANFPTALLSIGYSFIMEQKPNLFQTSRQQYFPLAISLS